MDIFLSIIIPTYNEERRISKTLISAHRYLSKKEYRYEIIVVDDGSQDETIQVVKNLQKDIDNLRFIKNTEHHGKGYVVKQGMLVAGGQYCLFMDADNSTSIEHWDKMWTYFPEGYDVVIGSRTVKGSMIIVRQPYYKIALGKIGNLLIQVLFLPGIWDSQCGFKAFSAKSTQGIFSRIKLTGWAFDVEVLFLAKKMGYRIKEIPVTWINDPHSHVKTFDYFKFIGDLFRVRKGIH